MHRNGQPLFALCSFDLVAIPPAMFIVLNIVIKDKKVSFADLMKIASPGNIRG